MPESKHRLFYTLEVLLLITGRISTYCSAIFSNVGNIIALWISPCPKTGMRGEPGILQLGKAGPASLTSGKPKSWLASGQIGFNANRPSVSSFSWDTSFCCTWGFTHSRGLFYFTPRPHAKKQSESQKRWLELCTLSAVHTPGCCFRLMPSGFIQGLGRMGIKEDLHA